MDEEVKLGKFNIKLNPDGSLSINCQSSGTTTICRQDIVKIEDVELKLEQGQTIKKFYDMERYFK